MLSRRPTLFDLGVIVSHAALQHEGAAMLAEFKDGTIETIRVRAYSAHSRTAPLVLHLHGGAFLGGSCAESGVAGLLVQAGAAVVSADYPVGSGHPFPAALEAIFAVLARLYKDRARWADKAARIFVAGEEAGGNLAAALAMVARDRRGPPVAGQILLSPMLDAGMATCSIRTCEAGPVGCKWADGWHDYLGSPERASHPYAAPASASRLAGLPPALVITAEDDPMRDESLAYAQALRASGVAVTQKIIAAPSGWPDALACPMQPPRQAELLGAFTAFFSSERTRHD
jgi:acetyl esterase